MLKRFLPVLSCLILFSTANAQRKNAMPFYKAGLAYMQSSNFGEALNSFAKAVSLDKKYDSAYVEMANLYSGSGQIDSAIANYNRALVINPKYTLALIGMGKICRDATHNLDSALIYYNAAEQLDKTNKETYYALAWIYNAKKEYEKAIPYAVRSLEIDNTYKPSYGELGHAYRASKKFAECIEQLKKNLAVSVVDVALLYSGFAYLELNDKAGAIQQYEALLKVNEKMAAGLKRKIDAVPQTGN
jgi:tetratricopeptide (TPR) repeat protein